MEFVEGESLRALLRRGLMDRCVAVRLLGELADAVAATHGQGVLHLDIKPENLMVRAQNGRLVLIDFGLAAVAEGGALATHMSSVGGTLDYMAPEQLMGHVSAGADIYACGAVALEMLAGKRVAELELPPNNQDLALTAARVRAAVTGVPEEAVVVLARMLSLRPEERPTGLAELVRALG
jgi:serine/threonine-protein kinase